MVNVRKRGNSYQYYFEIAPVGGKRKQKVKSGFKTKTEAYNEGIKAYNEYTNTGHSFTPKSLSYSDYLDYWLKEHCYINLKYHTIQAYENIIKNHIKPKLGFYRLSQITTSTLQEFVNNEYVEYGYSKNFMKNILKVLKASFTYATDVVQFVKDNPALKVRLPKYDVPDEDPVHIFTKEEVEMILDRFQNNHAAYYAFLTAYYTGLRVSEVFGLTWEDIDFKNKTLTVNKNILKKNQNGATHGRHISGKATTLWYFGTCKTQSSYRTIDIGDTLINALKEYKEEQGKDKIEYGDLYMKWDMGAEWKAPNFYSGEFVYLNDDWQEIIPMCIENINYIKENAKMMTPKELEQFIKDDYSIQIGKSTFVKTLRDFLEKKMEYCEFSWYKITKIDDKGSWKFQERYSKEICMQYDAISNKLIVNPAFNKDYNVGFVQDVNGYYSKDENKMLLDIGKSEEDFEHKINEFYESNGEKNELEVNCDYE